MFKRWCIVTGVLLVGAIVGTVTFVRTPGGRRSLHALLLKIPVLSTVVVYSATERFTRILAVLLDAGVPLTDAMPSAIECTTNVIFRERLSSASEGVLAGEGFAEPISQTGFCDVATSRASAAKCCAGQRLAGPYSAPGQEINGAASGGRFKKLRAARWRFGEGRRIGRRKRGRRGAGPLAGGGAQWLAMGRALMAKPTLLMLDEPSLGLAPLIVKEILRIVVQLKGMGVSILLVEQNARAALQVADYGYVLELSLIHISEPTRPY